jgi:hypothetical protein
MQGFLDHFEYSIEDLDPKNPYDQLTDTEKIFLSEDLFKDMIAEL